MPAWEAGAGVSKSGSPTPRSSTSSPAALRRLASLLMATVSDALRCCTLIDNGSGIQRFHDGVMCGRDRENFGARAGDVNRCALSLVLQQYPALLPEYPCPPSKNFPS